MLRIIIAVLFTLSFIFISWKLLKKLNLLDKPGKDQDKNRKPVPTMLGIFIFFAFVFFIKIAFPDIFVNKVFLGLIAGSFIIIIVSFLDELHYIGKIKVKIPIWLRMLSHVVGAIVAVLIGGLQMPELIIGNHIILIPYYLFILFFIIRSFLCINAINWFDFGNGQASGISAIGFLSIVLLIMSVKANFYNNITQEHLEILRIVQILGTTLFGLSVISTIIERKPIGLIRDVGTMFFGFALAYLSVLGGAKIGTLVIAISLVIFDAIRVGLHRIFFLKKNPTKGDYTHLHHRLIGLGRNKSEVRIFVRLWSIIMMILILIQGPNRINKIIIFILMAFIFFGVNIYIFWIKKLKCGLSDKK